MSGDGLWLISGVRSISAVCDGVDPNDQLNDNRAWPRDGTQSFGPQVTGPQENNHGASATRTQHEVVSPIPLDDQGWAVAQYGMNWCVDWFIILCTSVEL